MGEADIEQSVSPPLEARKHSTPIIGQMDQIGHDLDHIEQTDETYHDLDQTDHDLDHLVPHLPLWDVVQDLYGTDPTQET